MKNYFIAKSRRVRSTPYTSRIENQGLTAYTVLPPYNAVSAKVKKLLDEKK